MDKKPVIISGGGICGLAAALGAVRAGYDVTIIEKAVAFEELGAGLQLGPNAVRALEMLGAWPDVAPIARAPDRIEMRRADTNIIVRQQTLGPAFMARFGAPYRVAHRADLHRALLHAVERQAGITLVYGDTVVGMTETSDAISMRTAQGRLITGCYLVAADGVHSATRQKLVGTSAPERAGYDFHRLLLPVQPGDAEVVGLWMGEGFHCVQYTVGQPAQLNVVWTTPTGRTPADYLHVMSPELAAMAKASAGAQVWPGWIVRPLGHWVYGRTILLGDAAHATVPFLAQGAAMALEDAAWLMGQLSDGQTINDTNRRQRTARLHAASLRQGQITHLKGLASMVRDLALRHMPESMFWNRLDWIYRHDEARPPVG